MSILTGTIQLRKDTEANWTSSNPVLLSSEVAVTTDDLYTQTNQPRFKIGNGTDTWSNLNYQPIDTQLTALVVNGTGSNLLRTQYKVVKVTTAQGQRLQVNLAQANNDPSSVDTLGIVSEDIASNQEGYIMLYGQINNINTTGSLQGETWTDGDPLYLSATVAGGITNVKPTAPNHTVALGYVEYVNANNGKIFVKIQNGYELNELHDVYAPNPIDNDTIVWSSGNTRYENKQMLGLPLNFFCVASNPTDATSLFCGNNIQVLSVSTLVGRIYVPKSGKIKAVYLYITNTAGTSETSSIYVRINDTTDHLISSSIANNSTTSEYNVTNLNISVNKDDFLLIKWITPTWVTNPTNLRLSGTIYIE